MSNGGCFQRSGRTLFEGEIIMKKLLVLLFVVALAPAAFATPSMEIDVNGSSWNGSDGVLGSDIIDVRLIENTAGGFVGWSGISVNVSAGDAPSSATANPDGHTFIANIFGIASDGSGGLNVTGNAAAIPFPNGTIVEFSFHVPSSAQPSTNIIISATAGNFGGDVVGGAGDTSGLGATIHVVPEPVTMSLLGLGGLALIRRRRA
jgi:hypothetical protein